MGVLLNLIASLLQWGMAALAAVNATRLNTPDTEATPGDYAAYVAGPALASAAGWILKALRAKAKANTSSPPDSTPATPLTDFVREVLQASNQPTPVPGVPDVMPSADWLHVESGRIVARLVVEDRIPEAERFLGLLKETAK